MLGEAQLQGCWALLLPLWPFLETSHLAGALGLLNSCGQVGSESYLRRPHEELLDIQLIQQQGPPDAMHGHAHVGLAVGDLQELFYVLKKIKRKEFRKTRF